MSEVCSGEHTFAQLSTSFTSIETISTLRDCRSPGRPSRLSHSSCALPSTSSFQFNVASRPQRPQWLSGTGSPGRPPRLSHSSWALSWWLIECCFTSIETVDLFGTGSSGRPPRLSHSSWALDVSTKFSIALRPHKPSGTIRAGSPGLEVGVEGGGWRGKVEGRRVGWWQAR